MQVTFFSVVSNTMTNNMTLSTLFVTVFVAVFVVYTNQTMLGLPSEEHLAPQECVSTE